MKNFIAEFKKFAMRGSVMDLAVGVIIGGAFQKIVSSVVSDIALPAVSLIVPGGADFTKYHIGPILVGNFLQATVDFLIIALCIFLAVKMINKFKKENPEPETPKTELLLAEIRDLLKNKAEKI